jgi:hypothetical protein
MRYYCRGALASVLLIVTHCAASAAPDYIEADSGELASAYGEAVAERAISDELTDTRTDMIKASLIPEQGCGDEPQFVLRDVYPYQVDPRDVMWIERYRVDCEKEQQRAILMQREVPSRADGAGNDDHRSAAADRCREHRANGGAHAQRWELL